MAEQDQTKVSVAKALVPQFTKYNYELITEHRSREYEARQEQIVFLLKGISTSSIFMAAGWIIWVSSSDHFPLSLGILIACGLHLGAVALSAVTSFLLVVAHHSSMRCYEEIERPLGEIYSSTLIAHERDDAKYIAGIMEAHKHFSEGHYPEVAKKWAPRIMRVNLMAWASGTLSVAVFVASIVADIYAGYGVMREREKIRVSAPAHDLQKPGQ